MALRTIRTDEDPILRKISKQVTQVTPRVKTLIEDMIETMQHADGVGLAAPQIGILKRIIVVQVEDDPMVFINPELIEESGEQEGSEGCLSIPGKVGIVKRPYHVKIKALNQKGEPIEFVGDELMARAICHEIDHLNGKLYTDIATNVKEID